jgi:hypothetical protein
MEVHRIQEGAALYYLPHLYRCLLAARFRLRRTLPHLDRKPAEMTPAVAQ